MFGVVINIDFPNNIKTNFEGYQELISKLNSIINLNYSFIEIKFENVSFFDANFAAILGVYIEKLEEANNIVTFNFSEKSYKVRDVLRRNEFLLQYGYSVLIDNFGTCVPYRKFRSVDDDGFQTYITEKLIGMHDFPQMTLDLAQKMVMSVFEIYTNAKTHGICNYIHTCGQVFIRMPDKPLQFCIVDSGITIKENVSKHFNKELESTEAIKWAMEMGNTTKQNETGGLGLGLIFDFVKLNRGVLQVISHDGFYEYKGGAINTRKLINPFFGTIVNITINLVDNKSYYLVDGK